MKGRKFVHQRVPVSPATRKTRAGVVLLALIIVLAMAAALWSAGGFTLLAIAVGGLR